MVSPFPSFCHLDVRRFLLFRLRGLELTISSVHYTDLIINLPVWVAWTRWISPYFYGFNWIARTQFEGRIFACEGITGAARNACDGTAVLVGFQFSLNTPLYVYPFGLLGFIIATNVLSIVVLNFYHPGGVVHAAQQDPVKNIPALQIGLDKSHAISRGSQVAILVDRLNLAVSTRTIFGFRPRETQVILDNIACSFPANQVSVIMGPSGAGKSSFLSLLANRLNSGSLSNFTKTGDILVNGQPVDDSTAALIAFVEQVSRSFSKFMDKSKSSKLAHLYCAGAIPQQFLR